jgi:hypothetical protein
LEVWVEVTGGALVVVGWVAGGCTGGAVVGCGAGACVVVTGAGALERGCGAGELVPAAEGFPDDVDAAGFAAGAAVGGGPAGTPALLDGTGAPGDGGGFC